MQRPTGIELLRRTSEVCWRLLIIAATIGVGVWLLRQVWAAVLSLVAAGLIAIGLAPLVDWLRRRGLPQVVSATIVFVGVLAMTIGVLAVVTVSISSDLGQLGQSLDESLEDIRDWAAGPPLRIEASTFDEAVDDIRGQLDRLTSREQALSVARMAVTFVGGLLLSIVLLFFFLKDGPAMADWSLGLFPAARRSTVARVARRTQRTLQGWLRGTVLIGMVEGIVVGVLTLVLGVPQFLPLAVITFFAAFFPIVGAIVAGGLVVLITLVETSLTQAVIAGIAILALQQLDGDILQPLIMGNSVRLHPVVVLLALTAGGLVAGITGALLAVPLTAVIANGANELRAIRREAAIELPANNSPPGSPNPPPSSEAEVLTHSNLL